MQSTSKNLNVCITRDEVGVGERVGNNKQYASEYHLQRIFALGVNTINIFIKCLFKSVKLK